MKKNYFILLVATLFVAQGIAQEVVKTQRILLTKRTADWCPYCGTYGWNYFKDAIEQNGDKAIYMAAHYDGALSDAAAEEITDNFGGFYQPRFFVNQFEQGVTASNVNAKLEILKSLVDDVYNETAVANCAFEPEYENGKFTVNAKVQFFQATQGDFYLGMYLLEDHVTAYQASIGANAVHRHLFRKSFTPETFGKPIINSSVNVDQTFDLDFSLSVADTTGHEYEIVGVIWEKVGEKYNPINTWKPGLNETVSGVFDKESVNSMRIYPNSTSLFANIEINLSEGQPTAQLEIFDATGQKIAVLLDGRLEAGLSKFQIEKALVGRSGLYFLQLRTPSFVKTEKVIFQ